jgi:hypothetical protein
MSRIFHSLRLPFVGAFQIHPRNKTEVGRRLALAFAKLTHLPGVVATGPVVAKASTSINDANTITVTFDEATSSGMALTPTQQCATHGKVPTGSACCGVAGGMPFEVHFDTLRHFLLRSAALA